MCNSFCIPMTTYESDAHCFERILVPAIFIFEVLENTSRFTEKFSALSVESNFTKWLFSLPFYISDLLGLLLPSLGTSQQTSKIIFIIQGRFLFAVFSGTNLLKCKSCWKSEVLESKASNALKHLLPLW